MRCSDTSISNISDEALLLVSVFLWGTPSHAIARRDWGRMVLVCWSKTAGPILLYICVLEHACPPAPVSQKGPHHRYMHHGSLIASERNSRNAIIKKWQPWSTVPERSLTNDNQNIGSTNDSSPPWISLPYMCVPHRLTSLINMICATLKANDFEQFLHSFRNNNNDKNCCKGRFSAWWEYGILRIGGMGRNS